MGILISCWLVLSPVAYAILAGRASANLIETDTYHKWTFRMFVAATIFILIFILGQAPAIICSEYDDKWMRGWMEHQRKFHSGGAGVKNGTAR